MDGNVETSKKTQIGNKRIWDKTDNCIFCEVNVTNFTRHIIRKHSSEIEVVRFCALQKGSKERKDFANQLRRRGNFLYNLGNEPLTQLLTEVFPRMAVDEISTVAKTNPLIKSFGARYLKCHREKHLVNVVSQKMRILARLVIQMKIEDPTLETLQDCLVPKYFDILVKSVKELKKDSFNLKAYRTLQESVLAQLILLNRRRSGEVERIYKETYECAPLEISQEEIKS